MALGLEPHGADAEHVVPVFDQPACVRILFTGFRITVLQDLFPFQHVLEGPLAADSHLLAYQSARQTLVDTRFCRPKVRRKVDAIIPPSG